MKHVGHIVEMDTKSGIGTVEAEGTTARTTLYLADLKVAGIEPRVGARMIYTVGARPPGHNTAAIAIEKLG